MPNALWGEDSKCYSITKDFNYPENKKDGLWGLLCRKNQSLSILSRRVDGQRQYSLLYRHSFKLSAPRKILKAQQFLRNYHCYEDITSIPDRLRWLRHQRGMMQKEVAEAVGLSRSGYIRLETGVTTMCAQETLDKLEGLFIMVPLSRPLPQNLS